jgi:arginyl-tRNA synthetase
MIKKQIKKNIETAIKKAFPKINDYSIEIECPILREHGDYSSNIAFFLARRLKKSPEKIANLLIDKIQNEKIFKKVFFKKPGFINFILSEKVLRRELKNILEEKEGYGDLKIGKGKKVEVEFISANPTGPLTVGNARGGPLGDTLANVFSKAGFKTEKAYYINNYGNQIEVLGHSVLKDEKATYKGNYINELNKKITEQDPYIVGQQAAIEIIKKIKETVKKINIEYDEWISEKELHESGRVDKVIEFLKDKKLIYKKDGAVWFRSSNFGDKRDRVLIKSDGTKTYLAGDIALHDYKFNKKGFDKVINVWGADHHGDVPGLEAAVEALGYKGRLETILLQFVTLFDGQKKIKMSKRAGNYVTMRELIEEVGSDVIRFFFLQRSADKHLDFDLKLAKEKSKDNPVYYIQYAHARMCSILKKVENQKIGSDFLQLQHPSELNLIKQLIRYPEVIEEIVQDYQVHKITQFALELAQSFSGFYRDCHVLNDNQQIQQDRIALVRATKIVLKDCLEVMGISSPNKM